MEIGLIGVSNIQRLIVSLLHGLFLHRTNAKIGICKETVTVSNISLYMVSLYEDRTVQSMPPSASMSGVL